MQKRKQNKSSKQKKLRKRGTKRVKKIYGGSRLPLFTNRSISNDTDILSAIEAIVKNMDNRGSNARKSLIWFSYELHRIPEAERYVHVITDVDNIRFGNNVFGRRLGYSKYIEMREKLVENRYFLAYLMLMFDCFRRNSTSLQPLIQISKYGDTLINLTDQFLDDDGSRTQLIYFRGNRFYGFVENIVLLLFPFLQERALGTSTRIPLELLKEHTIDSNQDHFSSARRVNTIPMLNFFLNKSTFPFDYYDYDVMAILLSKIGDPSDTSPFKDFVLSLDAITALDDLRKEFINRWPDMPKLTTWSN
jgi:hypothetical protein